MSAATIRETNPADHVTGAGIGALAVRAGLALERWGRRHAAATTRDDIVRLAARRRQALAAGAANDELVFRATSRG
ncbi:MAG: hypothetical protein QM598_02760 [Protaetiibacter sp.]